jgi:hypothetical protein
MTTPLANIEPTSFGPFPTIETVPGQWHPSHALDHHRAGHLHIEDWES